MSAPNSGLRRDLLRLLALIAVLVVLEFALKSQFYRSTVILSMIFAIAAIGLTLLMGFAGQLSIGQGAFFGIGAYTAALALQRLGLPVVGALALAALVPALLGFVIARPILRLAGHNLALATLALGAVFYVVATQLTGITGGIDPGINGLPALRWFGFEHGRVIFWLSGACLILCTAMALMLVDGRFGRALKAVRTSEIVASCTGIDVVRTKAVVFAIAAGFAGLSGALFGLFLRSFNATSFNISLSMELLMMVIVGSLTTIWGALFGALAIVVLPNLLEGFDHAKLLIYGLMMIAVMMFAPDGLAETVARLFTRRRAVL